MALDDADWLQRTCAELTKDPAYATGRRSFPRTLSDDDATVILEALHREVDAGAAERARQATRQGMTIACKLGCTGCCEELVLSTEVEALLIARFLTRPENAEARAGFLARYPAWRQAVGDAAERLPALEASDDAEAYVRAHEAQWRRRVLCAFNHEGSCTIYPVRPTACRNAHAVDTSERCYGDHPEGKPASRMAFVPLDDLLARVGQLKRAMHHAVGGARGRLSALCDGVARKLGTS